MVPNRPTVRLLMLGVLVLACLVVLALATWPGDRALAQACPPYCETPVITPAWHLHMCDASYQEQLQDNHCMRGSGVTDFPAGTNEVFIIYCHKYSDTVAVQVKDAGGGLQFINHPDGITYSGEGCETLVFGHRNGIPAAGSPYFTSAFWPEGPFSGVGRGIEWYIGLFVAFDQENYYGNTAEAEITARDPGANADPFGPDTIAVTVTSSSDPVGIGVPLIEEGFGSVFRTEHNLRFSQQASDAARNMIKVANRDLLTVTYCPRSCATPYSDSATWYQLEATITPTPLPTWPGPGPTATATPPPNQRVEYLTLRPAPADVGYVPEVSANKDRPNHLGYPSLYAGVWTRGTNSHYGMIQFDLSEMPEDAVLVDGRLELVGRESRFTKPGAWAVKLLDRGIDGGWRSATFDAVHTTAVLAQIGPTLSEIDLAPGRRNAFGFSSDQLSLLIERLHTTQKISFRVDGPVEEENNLFAWHTGVDVYGREPEPPDPALGPVLELSYRRPEVLPSLTTTAEPPRPTGTNPPPGGTSTATAPPATATGSAPTGTPLIASATPAASFTPTIMATPTAPIGASPTPGPTGIATATPTGPAEQHTVCVLAYDDRNADSRRDLSERLLAGVTIHLTHLDSGTFLSWTTDGANDPDYCWTGVPGGEYRLAAVRLAPGYDAGGPTEYRLAVPFPGPPAQYEFALRRAGSPSPSATATGRPTSTATSRPSASPTPSPQPTVFGPSGEVCLAVYDDRNGSGFRDAGENWFGGLALTVLDERRSLARELRSRADGPVCARLAVGVYYVRAELGPESEPTTAQEQGVLLTEGQRTTVEFGQRRAGRGAIVYLPLAVRTGPGRIRQETSKINFPF